MPPGSSHSRWATRTLDDAIRVGSLQGLAAAPCALVAVAFLSSTEVSMPALLACHLASSLVTLVVLRRNWDATVALGCFYAVLAVDLAASTGPADPLAVVTAWFAAVLTGTPGLLLRGRPAFVIPFTATAGIAATVTLTHPEWGHALPVAIVVGAVAFWPPSVLFRRALDELVARTDAQEATAEAQVGRVVVARATARDLAEDARVLHDSIINTLAAIASGGSWARDANLVRRACRRDIHAVESLFAGRRSPTTIVASQELGVRVRRTGLRGAELEHHTALVDPETVRALNGAVAELVRNAAKHAHVDEVVVDVGRHDDEIVVTVIDHGTGFDAVLIPGRGLAESVVARIEQVGGRVGIAAQPGSGTRVTLTCPMRQPEPADVADEPAAAEREVSNFRRAACWAWAIGVVEAGVVIEVGNRPGRLTWSGAALALVATLCLIAWWTGRRSAGLPRWAALLVVAGSPVGYLLGFAGVGGGLDEPYLWHPIGLTPLFVVLLVLGRSRLPVVAGMVSMTVVAVVVAARTEPDERVAAIIALAMVLMQLCQMVAWVVFHATLGRLGRRLVADQRRAAHSSWEAAAREAITQARERWAATGVRASVDLLQEIADGRLDPTRPEVRVRCDEEERYLRQLSLIDPDLVHLSDWFARALATARSRSVRLTLRSGDADVSDPVVADTLGRLIGEVVGTAPAGAELTISLFDGGGPRLHLVGPDGFTDVRRLRARLPEGWSLDHSRLATHALVIVRPAPPTLPARPTDVGPTPAPGTDGKPVGAGAAG